jgi:hypothetical protein
VKERPTLGEGLINYLDFGIDDFRKFRSNVRLFGAISGAKPVGENILLGDVEPDDFAGLMIELGLTGAEYPRGSENFYVSKDENTLRIFFDLWGSLDNDRRRKLFGHTESAIAYQKNNMDDWFRASFRSSNRMVALLYKGVKRKNKGTKKEAESYVLMMAARHYVVDPNDFQEDAEVSRKLIEGTLNFVDGLQPREDRKELKEIVADTFYVNMLYNICTDAFNAYRWELNSYEDSKLNDFTERAEKEIDGEFKEKLSHHAKIFEDFLSKRGYGITMDAAVDEFVYNYLMGSLEVAADEKLREKMEE